MKNRSTSSAFSKPLPQQQILFVLQTNSGIQSSILSGRKMPMRVTHMMQFQQALGTIQQQQARLLRAQEEASSGKKILHLSDNPVDTRRILDLRQELAAFTQLQHHRESLTASLGATENTLQGIETALMRAKEIALNGANGSVSAADKEILSQEVDQLFKQVVQLGNT